MKLYRIAYPGVIEEVQKVYDVTGAVIVQRPDGQEMTVSKGVYVETLMEAWKNYSERLERKIIGAKRTLAKAQVDLDKLNLENDRALLAMLELP